MEIFKVDTALFSRSKVEEVRNDLVEKTLNGEFDPLQVQMAINFYEKVFNGDDKKDNGLKHQIKASVFKAFEPYGKEADLHGFKLETAEAGVKYDYTADPIWVHLNDLVKSAEEKRKTREAQLKALKMPDRDKQESNNMVLDPDSGELYEEMPPVKTSSTIVKFTLKK